MQLTPKMLPPARSRYFVDALMLPPMRAIRAEGDTQARLIDAMLLPPLICA